MQTRHASVKVSTHQNLSGEKDHKDVIVIVGLGPTGLAAALETVKREGGKRPIVLITDRTAYERKPIYRVNHAAYDYLSNLVGKDRIKNLEKEGNYYHVQESNDVYYEENYDEIRIDRTELTLQEALLENKNFFELITVANKNEVKIDVANREVALANGRRIGFKYLLAADGVHHGIATQLMQQGVDLQYHPSHKRQIHSFHVIGCYELPGKRAMERYRQVLLNSNEDQERLSALLLQMKRTEWKMHSFPEARIFIVENTLYIGAEAPLHLRSDTEKDEWLRLVLRGSYSDRQVEKLAAQGVNQQRLFDTFNVVLEEATKIVLPLASTKLSEKNTSYVIQLGDALRAPHYQTGSGVVQGLLSARAWGKFLASHQTHEDLISFNDNINYLILENRERIEKFLERRYQRELMARNQGLLLRLSSSIHFGFDNSIEIEWRLLRAIQSSSFSEKSKNRQIQRKYEEIGTAYRDNGNYDLAIRYHTKAIQLAEAMPSPSGNTQTIQFGYFSRGLDYTEKGNYQLAVQDYKKVLSLYPKWPLAHNNLASIYLASNQSYLALKHINNAINYAPSQGGPAGRYYGSRAEIYENLGRFTEALEDYNTCLEIYSLRNRFIAPYIANRGKLHQRLGSHKLAIKDFDEAIALDPTDVKSLIARADSHLALGHYRRCIEEYTQLKIKLNKTEVRYVKKKLTEAKQAYAATQLQHVSKHPSTFYGNPASSATTKRKILAVQKNETATNKRARLK